MPNKIFIRHFLKDLQNNNLSVEVEVEAKDPLARSFFQSNDPKPRSRKRKNAVPVFFLSTE